MIKINVYAAGDQLKLRPVYQAKSRCSIMQMPFIQRAVEIKMLNDFACPECAIIREYPVDGRNKRLKALPWVDLQTVYNIIYGHTVFAGENNL